MIRSNRWKQVFLLIIISLMLFGCEKGKVITGLSGFIVTVQPDTYTMNDSSLTVTQNSVDFTITVQDSSGKYRSGVELFIDSPVMRAMAGQQIMWFEYPYGVPVYNAIRPVTDDAGGYQLRVGFRHGNLNYKSDIIIMSGSSELAKITFEVTSQ